MISSNSPSGGGYYLGRGGSYLGRAGSRVVATALLPSKPLSLLYLLYMVVGSKVIIRKRPEEGKGPRTAQKPGETAKKPCETGKRKVFEWGYYLLPYYLYDRGTLS